MTSSFVIYPTLESTIFAAPFFYKVRFIYLEFITTIFAYLFNLMRFFPSIPSELLNMSILSFVEVLMMGVARQWFKIINTVVISSLVFVMNIPFLRNIRNTIDCGQAGMVGMINSIIFFKNESMYKDCPPRTTKGVLWHIHLHIAVAASPYSSTSYISHIYSIAECVAGDDLWQPESECQ